ASAGRPPPATTSRPSSCCWTAPDHRRSRALAGRPIRLPGRRSRSARGLQPAPCRRRISASTRPRRPPRRLVAIKTSSSVRLAFVTPGEMLRLGIERDKQGDSSEAEKLFCAAAEAGNAEAMNRYGVLLGKRGDSAGAEEWYRKAAATGDALGAYNVAHM